MKKRLVSLIATAILTAGVLVGCGGGKYTDGTYTGEAQGTSGTIKVEVNVEKGKISTVEVVEHKETKTLIDGVKDNMIPEIIEGVEAVSGATNSSKGVLEAVNKALEGATK